MAKGDLDDKGRAFVALYEKEGKCRSVPNSEMGTVDWGDLEAVSRSQYSAVKDYLRNDGCNAKWPESLRKAGVTIRRGLLSGESFRFVPFEEVGATYDTPFPNRYDPTEETPRIPFVAGLPDPCRKDESALLLLVQQYGLVQRHVEGPARAAGLVVEKPLLWWLNLKGQPCEIDVVYQAERAGRSICMPGEAKAKGQRIIDDQIRGQVLVAFDHTEKFRGAYAVDSVIPWLFKVVSEGFYIIQFKEILRDTYKAKGWDLNPFAIDLTIQSSAIYIPTPRILSFADLPDIQVNPGAVHPKEPGVHQFVASGGSGEYVWEVESYTGATITQDGLYSPGVIQPETTDFIRAYDPRGLAKRGEAKAYHKHSRTALEEMANLENPPEKREERDGYVSCAIVSKYKGLRVECRHPYGHLGRHYGTYPDRKKMRATYWDDDGKHYTDPKNG